MSAEQIQSCLDYLYEHDVIFSKTPKDVDHSYRLRHLGEYLGCIAYKVQSILPKLERDCEARDLVVRLAGRTLELCEEIVNCPRGTSRGPKGHLIPFLSENDEKKALSSLTVEIRKVESLDDSALEDIETGLDAVDDALELFDIATDRSKDLDVVVAAAKQTRRFAVHSTTIKSQRNLIPKPVNDAESLPAIQTYVAKGVSVWTAPIVMPASPVEIVNDSDMDADKKGFVALHIHSMNQETVPRPRHRKNFLAATASDDGNTIIFNVNHDLLPARPTIEPFEVPKKTPKGELLPFQNGEPLGRQVVDWLKPKEDRTEAKEVEEGI